MPFWLMIAVGIVIHIFLLLQWIEIYSVWEKVQRWGGTVNIYWPFFVLHAAFIFFWCWVIFG